MNECSTHGKRCDADCYLRCSSVCSWKTVSQCMQPLKSATLRNSKFMGMCAICYCLHRSTTKTFRSVDHTCTSMLRIGDKQKKKKTFSTNGFSIQHLPWGMLTVQCQWSSLCNTEVTWKLNEMLNIHCLLISLSMKLHLRRCCRTPKDHNSSNALENIRFSLSLSLFVLSHRHWFSRCTTVSFAICRFFGIALSLATCALIE